MGIGEVLVGAHLDEAETGEVTVPVDRGRPAVTSLVPDHDRYVRCNQVGGIEAVHGYVTGYRYVA